MRRAAAALLLCMTAASASAQGYNPHAGDSVAPAPGTIVAPVTPNGVDWLNSMLGLSPLFLNSDGKINATYVNVDLSAYATKGDLTSSLASYLSIPEAVKTYLPLAGGTTTGPLNGYEYFSLEGSSASGASVVLTTDDSGVTNENTCLVIPFTGVTEFDMNVAGVSSNGTDAVMNRFSGAAAYKADGTLQLNNSTASNNYPGFGSPGSWTITPTVDNSTGCLVITAKAEGTGSWKWKAGIHYENLSP